MTLLHAMHGWIIYEWGKYGVKISYQFVVYIHGHLFSCIAAVLTNQNQSSALLQHQKYITFLKARFPYQHVISILIQESKNKKYIY